MKFSSRLDNLLSLVNLGISLSSLYSAERSCFMDSSYSPYQLSTAVESFLNINYNNSYKMQTLKQIIERLEGDPY